jgi:hypothetical protein
MVVLLRDEDRLWRDQNVPYLKDEGLRKIIETFGGNGHGQGQEERHDITKSQNKIPIRKFCANGKIPLHESLVIDSKPIFVTISKEGEIEYKSEIQVNGEIFIPNDTVYTSNPLPYIFDSKEEFEKYIELARKETLDSLFSKVGTEFRKYLKVEEHYYTLLVGDTIWSHFQDKFPVTHYVIIVGDNDSGKNSALLVYRFLGYRVFYVVSASAPNYYTVLGNREEGQVTIAEDEAQDLPLDKDKANIIKTGYATGGNVPKVELEGGRKTDSWLTYSHKWFAMEEIPEHARMKGILDRSLVMKFITGDVPYNIKEVIRSADDPELKKLYNTLIHVRKLLFCFRLINHNNPILNIKLNVKNRTAELTKTLIRLFQNSQVKQRILDDLSKFVHERNETKKNSFEAKLYNAIVQLIKERQKLIDENKLSQIEYSLLGSHTFSNEAIRYACKIEMDGSDIEGKDTAFYSPEFGTVTQRRITSTLKSKFKIKSPKLIRINDQVMRCIEFSQDYLDKIKSKYDIPDRIEIL